MPTAIVTLFEGSPPGGSPIAHAVAEGVVADRLGAAFLGGYQAALWALVPELGRDRRMALCATEPSGPATSSRGRSLPSEDVASRPSEARSTEEGGAHPKTIRCRLENGRVTGRKSFVTMGESADLLLVVARAEDGALRLVCVDARAPGVSHEPQPETPFAPEVPHGAVAFDDAPGTVLPGDGYSRYLKPFRTIEDIHVMAAALAYLTALGRRAGLGAEALAPLSALVAALVTLAAEDPLGPTTHVALAGVLDLSRRVIGELDLSGAPEEERVRWERDRPLLEVAGRVRAQRFVSAAAALGFTMRP